MLEGRTGDISNRIIRDCPPSGPHASVQGRALSQQEVLRWELLDMLQEQQEDQREQRRRKQG